MSEVQSRSSPDQEELHFRDWGRASFGGRGAAQPGQRLLLWPRHNKQEHRRLWGRWGPLARQVAAPGLPSQSPPPHTTGSSRTRFIFLAKPGERLPPPHLLPLHSQARPLPPLSLSGACFQIRCSVHCRNRTLSRIPSAERALRDGTRALLT